MRSLLLLLLIAFWNISHAVIIERVVAIVDNDIITLSDIDAQRNKLKQGKLIDDILKPNPTILLSNEDRLLEFMIQEKILDNEVRKNNLSITIERVEQEIRTIAKQNQVDRNQLKQALANEGVSFSEYQDFIKTRLERQSLIEREVASKIKISEDDIVAYYVSKRGNLSKDTFEYTLAHILFLSKKEGPEKARERAELVFAKLREGHSFEDLASQYSEDPNFTSGGLLGTFKAGEILKELETSATKLEVNQYSEIVPSKIGFHILKLLKKRIIDDPQFLKEKTAIHATLFQQSFEKQLSSWMTNKRQDTFVRINPK